MEPKSVMKTFMDWYVSGKREKSKVLEKIKELVEQEKDNYFYCTMFFRNKAKREIMEKTKK